MSFDSVFNERLKRFLTSVSTLADDKGVGAPKEVS